MTTPAEEEERVAFRKSVGTRIQALVQLRDVKQWKLTDPSDHKWTFCVMYTEMDASYACGHCEEKNIPVFTVVFRKRSAVTDRKNKEGMFTANQSDWEGLAISGCVLSASKNNQQVVFAIDSLTLHGINAHPQVCDSTTQEEILDTLLKAEALLEGEPILPRRMELSEYMSRFLTSVGERASKCGK